MTRSLSCDIAQARTDWLAGDPAAWGRYTATLHALDVHCAKRHRPRQTRRTRRLRRLRRTPSMPSA